jgi:hypothetical protein
MKTAQKATITMSDAKTVTFIRRDSIFRSSPAGGVDGAHGCVDDDLFMSSAVLRSVRAACDGFVLWPCPLAFLQGNTHCPGKTGHGRQFPWTRRARQDGMIRFRHRKAPEGWTI